MYVRVRVVEREGRRSGVVRGEMGETGGGVKEREGGVREAVPVIASFSKLIIMSRSTSRGLLARVNMHAHACGSLRVFGQHDFYAMRMRRACV